MTVVVVLKAVGKCLVLIEDCASASKCCCVIGKVFFKTRFVISSGPGAFFGDNLLMAFSSWRSVILVSQGTGSGYECSLLMSDRSAGGGGGKNVARNSAVFSSFEVALLIVGMYGAVGVVSMYFLTSHIDLSSASLTKSFHVFSFALLICSWYSFRFAFQSSSSILFRVFWYLLLLRFVSLLNFVRSSFHHLLLNGHGRFRGVVSSIAFWSAFVNSFAYWSTVSGLARSGSSVFGRYFCSLYSRDFQSVLLKLYAGLLGMHCRGWRSISISIGK